MYITSKPCYFIDENSTTDQKCISLSKYDILDLNWPNTLNTQNNLTMDEEKNQRNQLFKIPQDQNILKREENQEKQLSGSLNQKQQEFKHEYLEANQNLLEQSKQQSKQQNHDRDQEKLNLIEDILPPTFHPQEQIDSIQIQQLQLKSIEKISQILKYFKIKEKKISAKEQMLAFKEKKIFQAEDNAVGREERIALSRDMIMLRERLVAERQQKFAQRQQNIFLREQDIFQREQRYIERQQRIEQREKSMNTLKKSQTTQTEAFSNLRIDDEEENQIKMSQVIRKRTKRIKRAKESCVKKSHNPSKKSNPTTND